MLDSIRSQVKFIRFLTITGEFLLAGGLIQTLPLSKNRKMLLSARLIQYSSRKTLSMMGVHTVTKDRRPEEQDIGGSLIASNHMSYLDVLVLAAKFPGLFVTSVEVRDMPFLGLLSRLGGCLYVERRSREGLSSEVREISSALSQGLSVLLFPEATSTNADQVLRFRRPLFQAAIDAGTKVLPVTLNYISVDRQSFQRRNRDIICWYGSMPFLSHLLEMFRQKEITVLLTKHSLIDANQFSKEQLAEKCHEEVASYFMTCPLSIPNTVETSSSFSRPFTADSMDSGVSPV